MAEPGRPRRSDARARELVGHIARHYRRNHHDVLVLVSAASEEQLRWRAEGLNSIAHNLWHLARWADHLQSILSEMTPELTRRIGARPEIWTEERLVDAWGWRTLELGHAATGFGMDEDTTSGLALPAREVLIDYATRTFETASDRVESLTDDDLVQPALVDPERATWLSPTAEARAVVGSWVVSYLRHDAQHLGAMLTLRSSRPDPLDLPGKVSPPATV
jgi:hypothetical protein